MESSMTADWAGDEWMRYLVRITARGMGHNLGLTGDVAAPNPERRSPRTLPPPAAGLCSACDMDGWTRTPAVTDY